MLPRSWAPYASVCSNRVTVSKKNARFCDPSASSLAVRATRVLDTEKSSGEFAQQNILRGYSGRMLVTEIIGCDAWARHHRDTIQTIRAR